MNIPVSGGWRRGGGRGGCLDNAYSSTRGKVLSIPPPASLLLNHPLQVMALDWILLFFIGGGKGVTWTDKGEKD